MKNARTFLIVFASLSSIAHAVNFIDNGGFSDGLSGWKPINAVLKEDSTLDQAVFVSSTGFSKGVLVLQKPLANTSTCVEQRFVLGSANSYLLHFKYGYTNIASMGYVHIDWYDASDNLLSGFYEFQFNWETWPDPNTSDTVWNNSSYKTSGGFNGLLITKGVYFKKGAHPGGNAEIVPTSAAYGKITLATYTAGYRIYFDDISFEDNIVLNGDFDDLTGWTAYRATVGEGTGTRVWIASSGGATGGLVVQNAYDADGSGVEQTISDIGDFDSYKISFKFGYTNIGSVSSVNFYYYDDSDNYLGCWYTTFDWTTQPDPANDSQYSNSSWNNSQLWISKTIALTRGITTGTGVHTSIPESTKKIKIRLLQQYTGYRTYFDKIAITGSYINGEVISNGDFSDGLTNWTNFHLTDNLEGSPYPSGWVATSGTGSGGLVIEWANDELGAGVEQQVRIGKADEFVLSVDYGYENIGSTSYIHIDWYDSSDTIISGKYFDWTFDWQTAPDPDPNDDVYDNTAFNNGQLYLTRKWLLTRGSVTGLTNSCIIPHNAIYAKIKLAQQYTGQRTYFDNISMRGCERNCNLNDGHFDDANNIGGWESVSASIGKYATGNKVWICYERTNDSNQNSLDGMGYNRLVIQGNNVAPYDWIGAKQIIRLSGDFRFGLSFKYGYTDMQDTSKIEMHWLDENKQEIPNKYYGFTFDRNTTPDYNTTDTASHNCSANSYHWLISRDVSLTRGTASTGNSTTVPSNALYAEINLLQYSKGNATYFDDIIFEPISEDIRQTDISQGYAISTMLRGQNAKTSGSSDLEENINGRVVALCENASIRGVAGGLEADTYNWKTRTGQDVANKIDDYNVPGRTTLEFMREAADFNSTLLITVNARGIGTGFSDSFQYTDTSVATLSTLAADWVKYCNLIVQNYKQGDTLPTEYNNIVQSLQWDSLNGIAYDPDYDILLNTTESSVRPVTYWEIGNEPGQNPQGPIFQLASATYGSNYYSISSAMKSVDPSIKVGPCYTNVYSEPNYFDAVLGNPSNIVDFISWHFYEIVDYDLSDPCVAYNIDTFDEDVTQWIKHTDDRVKLNGRDPNYIRYIISEYNPYNYYLDSDQTLKQASYMIHAVASAEQVFAFARHFSSVTGQPRIIGSHYWLWPVYVPDTSAKYPVTMMYEEMMTQIGSVLVDFIDDPNLAIYVTKDKNNPDKVMIWALNFSNAKAGNRILRLNNLGWTPAKTRSRTLSHIEKTDYRSHNDGVTKYEVGWQDGDCSSINLQNFWIRVEPSTIKIITLCKYN